MANSKTPTPKRGRDPLLAKLKESGTFLDRLMDNESVLRNALAVVGENQAQGDALEAALPGAVTRAEYNQRPVGSRKQADYEARQARTPAAKAAQGVVADALGVSEPEASEPSSELAAQAKALVAQFTPEEMELVRDALLEREVDELPSYVSADEPDENDEHDGATWEISDTEWNAQLSDAEDNEEEGEEA